MNVFLDTSTLFKLYHREADSARVEAVLIDFKIEAVIQFSAAVSIQTKVQKFICSDKLLDGFLKAESLPTW